DRCSVSCRLPQYPVGPRWRLYARRQRRGLTRRWFVTSRRLRTATSEQFGSDRRAAPCGAVELLWLYPGSDDSSAEFVEAEVVGAGLVICWTRREQKMRSIMLRNISILAIVLSAELPIPSVTARGGDIFVLNAGANSMGEYTLSGAVVNASLVSGLNGPF